MASTLMSNSAKETSSPDKKYDGVVSRLTSAEGEIRSLKDVTASLHRGHMILQREMLMMQQELILAAKKPHAPSGDAKARDIHMCEKSMPATAVSSAPKSRKNVRHCRIIPRDEGASFKKILSKSVSVIKVTSGLVAIVLVLLSIVSTGRGWGGRGVWGGAFHPPLLRTLEPSNSDSDAPTVGLARNTHDDDDDRDDDQLSKSRALQGDLFTDDTFLDEDSDGAPTREDYEYGCDVDTPCPDGNYFCNFDYGDTGVCEDCPSVPYVASTCEELSEKGSQDCTSRCNNDGTSSQGNDGSFQEAFTEETFLEYSNSAPTWEDYEYGCDVDTPCPDDNYFCNFDYGDTGVCEDCPSVPYVASTCEELSEKGSQDCTSRCNNDGTQSQGNDGSFQEAFIEITLCDVDNSCSDDNHFCNFDEDSDRGFCEDCPLSADKCFCSLHSEQGAAMRGDAN